MAATLSIAMVGTRGVPARYGGFETAVEEVGSRLAARGHRVRVYTRTGNTEDVVREHLGMEVVTAGALRSRSLETLSHTAVSVAHLVAHRTDAAFVFNAANAPFLPLLRAARIPVATHVDGLEWRRAKWGPAGRRYYRAAETTAVRCSDAIIADARGIQDYYAREYGVPSSLIAYGAPLLDDDRGARVAELGLAPEGYHLVVARFEPENHVQEIVEGYVRSAATKPLVVVGSAPYSAEYTDRIDRLAQGDERVRLLGAVWDQELLDDLYASAFTYVHGHSVGGTNPSLLRAIGAGAPVVAFDVDFNREVVRDPGLYFRGPHDLAGILEDAERDELGTIERGRANRKRAEDYSWDDVADGYEQLARDLAARRTPGPWRTARRRAAAADRQDAPRPAAAAGDPALGDPALGDPPRRVLFDAYWWDRGPFSNRSVQRALIHHWHERFPQDELVLAVRGGESAAPSDLPPGARTIGTRLYPHALSNAVELGRLARTVHADVVVAHNYTPVGRVPAVTFVHDVMFRDHPEWFSRTERAYFAPMIPLLRAADAVATSSRTEADRIEGRSGRPVTPVGLGVPRTLTDAVPRPPAGIDPGLPFALCVGRLNVRKNLEAVLRAVPLSARLGPEAPLLVVGGAEHSGVAPDLPPGTDALLASGAVRLLGAIDDAELAWLYSRAAVTAFLSRDEGFGLPVLEATHFGSPLVLADTPVFRELADGLARFVPLDAPSRDVAAALDAAWGTTPDAAPRERLLARYEWDRVVERLRGLVP